MAEGDEDIQRFPNGVVGFWSQTRLLIEKNWKCRLRTNKKKLIGEIFFPVLYLLLLSFLVRIQPQTEYPAQTEPDSQPMNILQGLKLDTWGGNERVISVVPNTTETQLLCEMIQTIWRDKGMNPPELSFNYYSTVKELEDAHNMESGLDLAVVFTETSNKTSFNYTIMYDASTSRSPPRTSQTTTALSTCRSNSGRLLELPATCPVNGYFYSGFLALQYLVDQAILATSAASSGSAVNIPDVYMQNYPKQEFREGMAPFLRAVIPLYSVMPMAQMINSLLVLIVTEKEDRIKDGFRMIGVSDGAYWLSWFSFYSVIIGILSFLYTLVMHVTHVLYHINGLLLFLIFFLFGLSIITFAFALTPFFHKPKTAGIVGTLIMQCCGMLFMLQTFLQSTDSFLIPLRIISSVAFTTALEEACAYEYIGGIGFSDLYPSGRGARILYSLIFICFDIIFYALIAVYLDNVIPNEYGARKHPLFCFKWSFWSGRNEKSDGYRRSSLSEEVIDYNKDDPNVERVPPSMIGKEAIRINNVHKTYTSMFGSTSVHAVKGISLDIYKGQITAILGKNGAGKSTLFSIITGLVPPTKGTSVVFGMDTSDPCDLDKLRKITGVCLQSDLHFASLTVAEHLELYGKLRGLKGDTLSQEVACILEELKLTEKASTSASNLSGGQKRKLSVGIALVGDPKIILLDEPSAGVDPVSRRHLWSLLKRKKEGRVILLTTHFLDEADFLADRKAVIHNGVLKCHGSSLFLKNRFGVGYHLTIETEGKFQIDHCDSIVLKWAPDALVSKKVIGKEIKYCLPHSEVHVFADLFSDLESLMSVPNSPFKSYGVSMTTLEEVFLKISSDTWEERHNTSAPATNGLTDDRIENDNGTIGEECNLIPEHSEMNISFLDSMKTLCLLRIRRLIRSPQSMFFMLVMPSLLVAGGLALMRSQELVLNDSLLSFDDPKAIYSEGSQLRVAISENSSPEVSNFLRKEGFNTLQYSGIYSDLLNPNFVDPGTMAAVNSSETAGSSTNMRINGTFLHSPPLMLSMLSRYYQKKSSENITISANTNPFAAKRNIFDTSSLYAAFLIGPSFTFPAVGMVMELVKDREIRARNHLRVNGVSFGLYFASVFFVFGLLSVIVTAMQIGLIYIYALPAFMNPYALIVSVVLFLVFIPSCLLFSTVVSYFFDHLESAQSIFSPITSWSGTICGIAIIIMDGVSAVSGSKHVLITHGVFSALNIFYIPFGIFYWINKKYIICSILDKCDELSFSDYLSPEIVIMAVCLVIQIPVFAVLVFVADIVKNEGSVDSAIRAIFMKNASRIHASNSDGDGVVDPESHASAAADDSDVTSEKTRVTNILNGSDPIDNSVVLVQNLKKTYRPNVKLRDRCKKHENEGHQALKGINFLVEKGEVFGLLGHNGAGKTTAMRIIIAEEGADAGRVRLCGTDIHSSYSNAFLNLGYCAQHDPLWENITLREHLELYSVVRGIPKERRKRLINHFLIGLQIEEHADKKAAELSGGTKRKLSYGISMLGAPKIVLLDEPSTGMDPQSKRFLWNTVLGTFKDSRGAILTTHSMEEAEILCTRIAILAKGSFICIGSPQHLKSKYGTGYTLEIKLKSDSGDVADNSSMENRFAFVKDHFPDCKVNEIFDDKAVFSLTTASVQSISRTFSLLEQLKTQFDIEEYSFSQTTLEQIFLLFAKENDDPDNE